MRSIIGILDHFDQGSIREFEEIDLVLWQVNSGGNCSSMLCRKRILGGKRRA
jgi:hypothetical protein